MLDIAAVVIPVFLVVATGYLAAWRGFLSPEQIDGLMKFGQGIAIPLLLFRAISQIDMEAAFKPALYLAFYGGSLSGFVIGTLGARYLFKRDWEDAVAIGFVGLFTNCLLLGLPITERAYGVETTIHNIAIISFHAPFCYLIGITAMECVRGLSAGTGLHGLGRKIFKAVFKNTLIIGIAAGVVLNLSTLQLPEPIGAGADLIARAGIPAALFGLGGVLRRYRPEGDIKTIIFITCVSLIVHPLVSLGLSRMVDLPLDATRAAVLTAAMAPGVNAYLFADLYGRAKRVAASAVLLGTLGTILSASFWIAYLP